MDAKTYRRFAEAYQQIYEAMSDEEIAKARAESENRHKRNIKSAEAERGIKPPTPGDIADKNAHQARKNADKRREESDKRRGEGDELRGLKLRYYRRKDLQ